MRHAGERGSYNPVHPSKTKKMHQTLSDNNSTGVAFFGGASSSGGGGVTGPHYSAAGHSPPGILGLQALFGQEGEAFKDMYGELEGDSSGAAKHGSGGGTYNNNIVNRDAQASRFPQNRRFSWGQGGMRDIKRGTEGEIRIGWLTNYFYFANEWRH